MLDTAIPPAVIAAAAARPAAQGARSLAPLPTKKAPSTALRWVFGPGIMAITAVGTFFLAGVLLPVKVVNAPPPPKAAPVIGHIQLKTSPPGASVTVDGKPHPHFTPTTVDGNVGETVHIVVTLAGYKPHEQDLLFAKEDHPLSLELDAIDEKAAASKKPPAEKQDTEKPEKQEKPEHADHSDHGHTGGGKGTISVFVHPWAIVFVDGTRLRQTPIANFELSPGKHTFQLVNDNLKKKESVTVTIRPGANPEIRKEWAE